MSTKDILAAINDKKYPRARELLEKQIAEQPQNGGFYSMLCFVEYNQHNRAQAIQAAKTAIALGPTNLQVLVTFVCPALCSYGEVTLLSQAFDAFARKVPPTPQSLGVWTEYGFDMSHPRTILRAQTALNKLKTTSHSALACCYFMALEHERMSESDPEFNLYPMLAIKMLDRARPIRTPQPAYVEALVLKMSSKQKMVDYLLTPAVRAYDSLDLNVLLLDTLVELQNWPQIWTYAQSQLAQLDSYNYWQALVKAAVNLDKVQEFYEFAAKFKGHNVALAKIDMVVALNQSLLPAVQEFWQQMGSKPSAPQFLKPYLNQPVVDYLRSLTPSSFAEQVNLAKIDYMQTKTANVVDLVKLYLANLDKLPRDKTDYFIGTDLLEIAALEIINSSEPNKLAKAVLLLELASENDPSQFYVRLWLLRIYRYIGAFAKATAQFDKMSIRNLQLESLGHLVGTRVGSLHPDRRLVRDLLEVHSGTAEIGACAQTTLERGSYTQLPGMIELARKMRLSLSRILLEFEAVKTERVLRGTVTLSNVLNRATEYVDNRDFKTAFDPCETNGHLFETGPRQGAEWVTAQIAKEQVYLATLRGQSVKQAPDTSEELTASEKWNIRVVNSLGAGQLNWEEPPAPSGGELSWEFFHSCYTILETAKVVDDVLAKVKAKAPAEVKATKLKALDQAKAMQAAVQQRSTSEILEWAAKLGVPNADRVLNSLAQAQLRALSGLINALS